MDDQTVDFRLGDHSNSNSPWYTEQDEISEIIIQNILEEFMSRGRSELFYAKLAADDLMVLIQEILFDKDHRKGADDRYEKTGADTERFDQRLIRMLLGVDLPFSECDWMSDVTEVTIRKWYWMHQEDIDEKYKEYQERP